MNLTEAHEHLQQHVESLPPSVREPLEIVLGATCGTCRRVGRVVSGGVFCELYWRVVVPTHGCRAWEKREETTV